MSSELFEKTGHGERAAELRLSQTLQLIQGAALAVRLRRSDACCAVACSLICPTLARRWRRGEPRADGARSGAGRPCPGADQGKKGGNWGLCC